MSESEWKFDAERSMVFCDTVGCGTWMYSCFVRDFAGPVGLVWGVATTADGVRRFDMYFIYVLPTARRHGIARRLNSALIEQFDLITTGAVTPEGKAFLEGCGYQWQDETKCWYFGKSKEGA